MEILSSCSHPIVIGNLYNFLTEENTLKNVFSYVLDHISFHYMDKTVETLLVCVPQRK